MPIVEKERKELNVLSDREAEEAIRMMKHVRDRNQFYQQLYNSNSNNSSTRNSFSSSIYDLHQPWFIQVWFNAPHGPWEILQSGLEVYTKNFSKTNEFWKTVTCAHDPKSFAKDQQIFKYKTMVTAMDKSIGMLLDAIKELGIEEETVVVFTSDNGQEMGAGNAGPFREGKRSLMVRIYCVCTFLLEFFLSSSEYDGSA